ncbi:DUF1642 domain-containing protein [Cytobacillus sp. FSL K6-0129]|uniref:DUF1642 domain-containing protein n=1 Tax=Cytobacillus sp. FSL K6-0129 TaxID=2921421 RepID=UPI0030F95848
MANKVTIPKGVAEAIEKLREYGWEQANLLNAGEFINTDRPTLAEIGGEHIGFPIAEWLSNDFHANYPNYVSALVNGYEIEQSPEDKLREYYAELKGTYDSSSGLESYRVDGMLQSVETTLDILGIQIEGINAGGDS